MVIDASMWVSASITTDVHYQVSRAWLGTQARQGAVFTQPWLFHIEVSASINRRTGNPTLARRAVAVLDRVRLIEWIVVDQQLASLATRLAIDLRLRGADAVYVAVAQLHNLPLVTWDAEQLNRAAAAIAVYSPTI